MDMMTMYFHQRVREHILFKEWVPTNNLQFVLSCIGVIVLGILLELFKTFRLYLYRRSDKSEANNTCCGADVWTNTTAYGATFVYGPSNIPSTDSACECSTEQAKNNALNIKPYSVKFLLDRNHQIQSILFLAQSFFSFSLMLVAMTYNTVLFLSLIAGHTIGFYFTQPIFTPAEKVRVGDCCCG